MKLTVFFLIIGCLQVAAKGFSQERVSLSLRNTELKTVFKEISDKTPYRFLYQDNIIPKELRISVSKKDVPVTEILSAALRKTGLNYRIVNNNLVVIYKITEGVSRYVEEARQTVYIPPPVRGAVTDSSGKPVVGATVNVKGTKKNTITDAGGNFTVEAVRGEVLVISSIGYETKEITITGEGPVAVVLKAFTQSMNDVVVVGYGTTKKIHLTGAVASVDAKKLENRPLVNLGDGLQGLVPGLNISINNGQPGTGASFNIRGLSTLNSAGGGQPLILVDGVARDPNLIDPNDVASVTVLKDAASATIYGGRAAYGVVLITTKRGKTGAPRVDYSGSYTIARPASLPKMASSKDYLNLFNSAQRTGLATGGNTATSPLTPMDSVMIMAYYNDPAHNPYVYVDPANPKLYRYVSNTDWVKELYPGWAPMQQHNISLSGGVEKINYLASMGYFSQDGLQKSANQVYKRYTPSLKLTSKVNDWLSLDLSMSLTHTDNNKPALTLINQGGSWMPGDLRPIMPVYHPDGHFSGQGSNSNPEAINALSGRDINYINDFWTTARATITPIKHITWVTDYTWNAYSQYERANLVPFNEYGANGALIGQFAWTRQARVQEFRTNNTYYAFNSYGTYENTFAQKHYIKAMLGYNQEYSHFRSLNPTALVIVPSVPAININNDPKPVIGGVETEYALIGTFFRVNYAFNNKYLLEVDGRYDGTSRFLPGHQYVFSPSISAGWDIARETFMQDVSFINQLKLRASYGNLPNQRAPSSAFTTANIYPFYPLLTRGTSTYLFAGQPAPTFGAPPLVRNDLTWEKVATSNAGIDFGFLKNKLNGSFDYYITNVSGLITSGQPLPGVLGTGAPQRNSAALRTKGWEFILNWNDRLMDNQLGYGITLNLSDALTTVTDYNLNPTQSLGDLIPGRKLGDIWGYTTEGFYKTDAEAQAVDNSRLAGYKWLAGDIKFKDLNGDNKINNGANTLTDHGDLSVIGNSQPRYKFGLNLTADYKGFDFAMFFQGLLKQDYNPVGSTAFSLLTSQYNTVYQESVNSWSPDNPNAYLPRPRFGGGNNQPQTKYMQNAAYARLKQLTLGYTLPATLLERFKIKKVRAYITGANLFAITSLFNGIDPDLIAGYTTYPISKSISAGIQIGL